MSLKSRLRKWLEIEPSDVLKSAISAQADIDAIFMAKQEPPLATILQNLPRVTDGVLVVDEATVADAMALMSVIEGTAPKPVAKAKPKREVGLATIVDPNDEAALMESLNR